MASNNLRKAPALDVRGRLHAKIDQAAMRELRHRHEEEFQQIRHRKQHELGEPHIHEVHEHEHAQ